MGIRGLSVVLLSFILFSSVVVSTPINNQMPAHQAFAEPIEADIRDIGSYTVYGLQNVVIEMNVTINTGNVGVHDSSLNMQLPSNAEIRIKNDSSFIDSNSAVVGDTIIIRQGSTVQNVFFNDLLNEGTIVGIQSTPLELPVVNNLPDFPNSIPGSTPVNVPQGSSLTLGPGLHGDIFVGIGATLTLTGGIYNVTSIDAKKDSNILFDDSSIVVIQNQIKWEKGVRVGPSETSSIGASDIVMFVGGNADINEATSTDLGKDAVVDANIFVPNGQISMAKGTMANGAFIAKTVIIHKNSIITHDPAFGIFAFVNDYSEIIEELEEINNIPDEEIIDLLESKVGKLREIVSVLESKGFTANILVQRMSPTTSSILFINSSTLQSFEVSIPNNALAALLTIGIFEESSIAVQLTGTEINAMLNAFPNVIVDIANLPDEILSIEFLEFVTCVGIADSANDCFPSALVIGELLRQIVQHPEILDFIAEQLAIEGFIELGKLIFPQASISGFKFNDVDKDGVRIITEPLLANWNFTITSKFIGGIDSGIQTQGKTNSTGFYNFNGLDYPVIVETIVIIEDLDQNLIDQGWVNTTSTIVEIPFSPDLVRTDINFGNRQEATLNVTKIVINDDAGTAVPLNFTISVTGTNVSPSSFLGNSSGTTVTLDEGSYTVTETGPNGYIGTLSADCSGTISFGETKTCTITNDDDTSELHTNILQTSIKGNADNFQTTTFLECYRIEQGTPEIGKEINTVALRSSFTGSTDADYRLAIYEGDGANAVFKAATPILPPEVQDGQFHNKTLQNNYIVGTSDKNKIWLCTMLDNTDEFSRLWFRATFPHEQMELRQANTWPDFPPDLSGTAENFNGNNVPLIQAKGL